MEYEIISADTLNELVERVNKNIEVGWHPQGGVAVIRWEWQNGDDLEYAWEYSQAMT